MSTGFTNPTVITKKAKGLSMGVVVNDVIYTCPSNCYADVYFQDYYVDPAGQLNNASLDLYRLGITSSDKLTIAPAQTALGGTPAAIVFSGGAKVTPPANSFSNSMAGDPAGCVIRLLPGDFLAMNYQHIIGGVAYLNYTTVEVFGQ